MRPSTAILPTLAVLMGAGCALPAPAATPEAAPVECMVADFQLEPTFDRPELAVADAVIAEAELGPLPKDLTDYERIEQSEGWVTFEHRDGDDVAIWTTAQDDDGRWGVVALETCRPDRS